VNPSTAQARVVVDELIRGGVRDVVLCPGSRNAPLAFALQDADRAGRGWRSPRARRSASP
jgi:2-succinyl-5-enolpyruvyl-6-hydroxy-3-cyclohexene-1-carboxylate synthase